MKQRSASDAIPESEAERLERQREEQRQRELDRAREDRRELSGPGKPVDHERQPGVPPPSTDDYEDMVDIEGAESFPASDPPSGW